MTMPADHAGRDAYAGWAARMGHTDGNGAPLPAWGMLPETIRQAWAGMAAHIMQAASAAAARMNQPRR